MVERHGADDISIGRKSHYSYQVIGPLFNKIPGDFPDSVYAFRPPYGKLNLFSFLYLCLKKAQIVYWDFDSGDTRAELPEINSRLNDFIKKGSEGIILMHDFDRDSPERNDYTIEFTRRLLKDIVSHRQ